ncbi:MAG: flagellar hook-basal body complex protein, partial [Huintestinicola sp.]
MVRSLYSGVSGLKSHQTRMDVIGNNIANVNTYGFKASRTSFADIYYQAARSETGGRATFAGNNSSQVGYGVQVASIDKDMSMSNFQNTNRTLDLAIAGDGMFIVGTLDRNAQVSSVHFTRMGNFGVDSAGNLVNALNEFVLGTKNKARVDGGTYSTIEMTDINPADVPNELDTLNINDLVWDAYKPDCEIDFDDIPAKYRITDTDAGTTQVIFTGNDPYDTTRQIAYDRNVDGMTPATVDEIAAPAPGEPPTEPQEVASDYILYSVNGKYVNNQGVIFDADKGLYVDKDGLYYTYSVTTTKDSNGNVQKTHSYTLQNENDDGTFTPTTTTYIYNAVNKTYETTDERGNTIYADMTDSYLKYSDLDGFTVGSDGVITAQFASQMKALCRLDIATFDNIEGLNEVGDTEFVQTAASGEANIKRPGESGAGSVQSNKLEMSNVNLANEFSDMIVTQRGYQANARIITT